MSNVSSIHSTGIILLDTDMKIELINPAFYRVFSIAENSISAGQDIQDILGLEIDAGIHDIQSSELEKFLTERAEEVVTGDIKPRPLCQNTNKSIMYSVTRLDDGRRMLSYLEIAAKNPESKSNRKFSK